MGSRQGYHVCKEKKLCILSCSGRLTSIGHAEEQMTMADEPTADANSVSPPPESQIELRIAVGSSNPAKIRAVEQALRIAMKATMAPTSTVALRVQGFSVESGVPDQPFGDAETLKGSKNRARAAYAAYRRANQSVSPHMALGLEGGLEWASSSRSTANGDTSASGDESEHTVDSKDVLYCMAWMSVYGKRDHRTVEAFASANTASYPGDKGPVFGLGKTAAFPIPDQVADLVRDGMELGDADDKVFGRVQSKHGDGIVGLLTDGRIDRSAYYEHAITLALLPWMRPDLYPSGN